MAWGWPTSARIAARASRASSSAKTLARAREPRRASSATRRRRRSPAQGVAKADVVTRPRAQLRYAGSDTALEVDFTDAAEDAPRVRAAHKARFGFIDRAKTIVVEAVNVEASGGGARFAERARQGRRDAAEAGAQDALLLPRRLARGATSICASDLALGARVARPGAHHRAASDHRRRGRLARRDHARRTMSC